MWGTAKPFGRDFKPNVVERGMRKVLEFLKMRMYAPVLRFAMNRPWITFSSLVALFLITVPGLIGGGMVKTTFFPTIEGDNLTVNLSMVSGTREEVTLAELDKIESHILAVNEELKAGDLDGLDVVLAVDKRVGPSAYTGLINVQLLDGERRNMRSMDISEGSENASGPFMARKIEFCGIFTVWPSRVRFLVGQQTSRIGRRHGGDQTGLVAKGRPERRHRQQPTRLEGIGDSARAKGAAFGE